MEIWPQFCLFQCKCGQHCWWDYIYVRTHCFRFPVVVFIVSILKQARTLLSCREEVEGAWPSGSAECIGRGGLADINMGRRRKKNDCTRLHPNICTSYYRQK